MKLFPASLGFAVGSPNLKITDRGSVPNPDSFPTKKLPVFANYWLKTYIIPLHTKLPIEDSFSKYARTHLNPRVFGKKIHFLFFPDSRKTFWLSRITALQPQFFLCTLYYLLREFSENVLGLNQNPVHSHFFLFFNFPLSRITGPCSGFVLWTSDYG